MEIAHAFYAFRLVQLLPSLNPIHQAPNHVCVANTFLRCGGHQRLQTSIVLLPQDTGVIGARFGVGRAANFAEWSRMSAFVGLSEKDQKFWRPRKDVLDWLTRIIPANAQVLEIGP